MSVGDAEDTFPSFVAAWAAGNRACSIRGFNRPDQQGTSACSPVAALDAFAFPEHFPRPSFVADGLSVQPMDLKLFKRHSRYTGSYLSVMTTRGCPFNCAYCCNHLLSQVNGKTIRRRSPGNVIQEIEWNIARSPIAFSYVDLIDDCFTIHSTEWLQSFVSAYRAIGIPLALRAIPQLVTEEKIGILRDAPTGFALLGLQSGSERTNKIIYQRSYSRDRVLKCARLLHQNRIPAIYDVIVDNPYETRADWEKTIDLVSDLPATSFFFFYSLTFYKNTLLYEKAKNDGLDVDQHLTKSQDHYDEDSMEHKLVNLALYLPPAMVKWLLHSHHRAAQPLTNLLVRFAQLVLDPIRLLRLAHLSQQGRLGRFGRLLVVFTREFINKVYFPSKVPTGYQAAESTRHGDR